MQISGKTLQNLVKDNTNLINDLPSDKFDIVKNTREFIAKCKVDGNYNVWVAKIINKSLFKLGETYTVIFNDEFKWECNSITLKDKNTFSKQLGTGTKIKKGIFKFTINSDLNSIDGDAVLIAESGENKYTNQNTFKFSDVMILEGEPKEIPSYFEGIKSVGEAEGNKISILTKGKNLFNIDEAQLKSTTTIEKNYSSFVLNGTGTWAGTQQKIKLKPKTTYTISGLIKRIKGGTNCYVQIRDKVKNTDYNRNYFSTFTTPSDISDDVWLYFVINSDKPEDSSVEFSSVQLEEGSTATNYEPYKEDKTEILLPSPHMGLPNGVSDVIDYDKNERIKNVDKATFNGSEGWTLHPYSNSNFSLFYCYSVIGFFVNCLSNKFPLYHGSAESLKQETQEYIWGQGKGVFIWIKNDKLETPDANGFKKLLQSWADAGTPLEVYYQLAEPKTEKLNIKDTLQTFKDGYIMLDNAITPTTSLEYSMNLPSVLSGVVEIQDKILDRVNILEKKKSITWDELEGV